MEKYFNKRYRNTKKLYVNDHFTLEIFRNMKNSDKKKSLAPSVKAF